MARIKDEINQTKSFRSKAQETLVNLSFTANWLHSKQKIFFDDYGLTATQFNALRILKGSMPIAISTRTIRERLIDRGSDASRIVERLWLKKLVVKNICDEDKRLVNVEISEKGLELLLEIEKDIEKLDLIFKNLSAEETESLNDLLDKLRD